MMRTLALAVVLVMLASPALAQHHGNFHHSGNPHWGGHYGDHGGSFLGGAIIGGLLGSLFRPAPPVVVVPGRTIEWCMANYRSYNPETGVYLGFDGQYHACP